MCHKLAGAKRHCQRAIRSARHFRDVQPSFEVNNLLMREKVRPKAPRRLFVARLNTRVPPKTQPGFFWKHKIARHPMRRGPNE